jgi:hypothetical protein
MGGAPEDLAKLERFRDLGAARVNVSLPAEPADKILPMLDRWAKLKRQLGSWHGSGLRLLFPLAIDGSPVEADHHVRGFDDGVALLADV